MNSFRRLLGAVLCASLSIVSWAWEYEYKPFKPPILGNENCAVGLLAKVTRVDLKIGFPASPSDNTIVPLRNKIVMEDLLEFQLTQKSLPVYKKYYTYCNEIHCTDDIEFHTYTKSTTMVTPKIRDELHKVFTPEYNSAYLAINRLNKDYGPYQFTGIGIEANVMVVDRLNYVAPADSYGGYSWHNWWYKTAYFFYEGELQSLLLGDLGRQPQIVISTDKYYFEWLQFYRRIQLPVSAVLRLSQVINDPIASVMRAIKRFSCPMNQYYYPVANTLYWDVSFQESFPNYEMRHAFWHAVRFEVFLLLPAFTDSELNTFTNDLLYGDYVTEFTSLITKRYKPASVNVILYHSLKNAYGSNVFNKFENLRLQHAPEIRAFRNRCLNSRVFDRHHLDEMQRIAELTSLSQTLHNELVVPLVFVATEKFPSDLYHPTKAYNGVEPDEKIQKLSHLAAIDASVVYVTPEDEKNYSFNITYYPEMMPMEITGVPLHKYAFGTMHRMIEAADLVLGRYRERIMQYISVDDEQVEQLHYALYDSVEKKKRSAQEYTSWRRLSETATLPAAPIFRSQAEKPVDPKQAATNALSNTQSVAFLATQPVASLTTHSSTTKSVTQPTTGTLNIKDIPTGLSSQIDYDALTEAETEENDTDTKSLPRMESLDIHILHENKISDYTLRSAINYLKYDSFGLLKKLSYKFLLMDDVQVSSTSVRHLELSEVTAVYCFTTTRPAWGPDKLRNEDGTGNLKIVSNKNYINALKTCASTLTWRPFADKYLLVALDEEKLPLMGGLFTELTDNGVRILTFSNYGPVGIKLDDDDSEEGESYLKHKFADIKLYIIKEIRRHRSAQMKAIASYFNSEKYFEMLSKSDM